MGQNTHLMKDLSNEDATPVFVRRFFSEHIGEIYVRDYKSLRTENHPLRLRYEIIAMVNQLCLEDPYRTQLLQGYRDIPGAMPGEEEESLETDRRRFMKLLDVEKFLDRMDYVVDDATQRAIAILNYRLKASERIEAIVSGTIDAICAAEAVGLDVSGHLLTPDAPVGDSRLRLPTPPPPKPNRIALQRPQMTTEQRARSLLRRMMVRNREMTPTVMRRYIESSVPAGATVDADEMPIAGVGDAVAFLALSRMAAVLAHEPSQSRRRMLQANLGFQITPSGGRVDNDYFNTPHFTITRNP